MTAPRSQAARLDDIAEAIAKVQRFLSGKTFEDFSNDSLTHDAVARNLEIISEASRHLAPETKARAPEVPWRNVADIGNWLRHAYEKVNDPILWKTIQDDLPVLSAAVHRLLREVE
ncbi:MAG: DUF86 domain-containing protein [Alphaproteobacteria bacterium]|nr:DUF86 domain-containing protein [Alphaproteobacteria bacterium]MBV9062266.1 DUF86 domain-containing protein [Alphaproteobacteria bacterium]